MSEGDKNWINNGAEKAVLSAMMKNKNGDPTILQASSILQNSKFYDPKYQAIFDAILEVYKRNNFVDILNCISYGKLNLCKGQLV